MAFVRRKRNDVRIVEKNCTGIGKLESCDDAQQRCFAAAGRSQQGEELARLDCNIDVVKSGKITELLGDMVNGNLTSFQFKQPLKL
jgi:hypothetical protein